MKITELHNVPMPAPIPLKPKPVFAQPSIQKCITNVQPDGAIRVEFLIEPDVAARLLRRANGQDMAKYLWENILHRSIESHVY